jgi:hypothetical protein
VIDGTVELTRFDEWIAGSTVGAAWIERSHFADPCALLWIDGELVLLGTSSFTIPASMSAS